tara:strand:- start:4176 stop:4778 length:603 start_codon:yes stop_codon:yes gene_type:complete
MIITVLDTETTGLDLDKHEIIEIALISYLYDRDGNRYVMRKYEQKIKPERIDLANPRALEINGYTDAAWLEARPAAEVLAEVKTIVEDSDILLGQNLIFDLRFVNEVCQRLDMAAPKFPAYVDTKEIADKLVKANWLEKSGMDYLVEHYNVEVSGRAHTALVDCERTMLVWDKLLEEVGEDYSLYTFEEPYEPYRRRRKS